MALKKKNVFQGFIQEDYVPSADQQVVKYLTGKGNNLHEVEALSGSTFLVSMPKKFRQTVWLKKGDCVVIDPISEGKKVLGEIVCVIPTKDLISMIKGGEWLPRCDHNNAGGDADSNNGANNNDDDKKKKDVLISFYSQSSSSVQKDNNKDDESMMPPSDEDESSDTESDEDVESGDEGVGNGCSSKGDVEVKVGDQFEGIKPICSGGPPDEDDDGFTSRVQFLTSGAVTVTSVVNDISSLPSTLQSLDFEAEEEDSSLENSSSSSTTVSSTSTTTTTTQHHKHNDAQDGCCSSLNKKANTIRIQVNFPPDS